jgi:two-component system, cell cycle response regulator DivK
MERTVLTDVKQANVVVVEDNADNLFIVSEILREDVGVKYCNGRASGRQFFKLLESNPHLNVDLILLDIQIPGEDGYAVLRQIRATRHLRHIKVVALTANVLPQDVQRARESGFDGFIGKPIDSDRFPQQIIRILAGESVWEPR